ncbi:MAG TPA: hypothetical protein VM221_11205 [Armatimonadota bacterium]|nr:hypothetical protein [Armatimonadota bacterium]
MTHMPSLRPRGLLEIIDETFRLYRANFWLFFCIAAIAYLPLSVVAALPSQYGAAVGALLLGAAGFVVSGALTKAVSDRYMGDPASFGSAYGYIVRRLVPFALTALAAAVFVMSGVLLLGVGMIVFAFWIAFVTPVFVIEDKRYFSAIWRSKYLVGQGVWAEYLVLGLITGILSLLIQSPALLLQQFAKESQSSLWLVHGLISGLANSLATPVGLVAGILLYYDSRMRKEGFDLEVLARELGKPLPAPPPATATSAGLSTPPPPPPAPPREGA